MVLLSKLLDRATVLLIGILLGAFIMSGFAESGGESNGALSGPPAGDATMAAVAPAGRGCPSRLVLDGRLQRQLDAGGGLQIGVFGDSFGDGLWAGLYNELRLIPTLTVHRFSKASTGFTHYSTLDLLASARNKLDEHKAAGQSTDLAVVSFGANDAVDIWHEGHLMPYMGADWQRVVGGRIRTYLAQLKDSGARVVWVGLPRMRKPKFDRLIAQMNAFNARIACETGVPFIDTVPKSVDGQGQFTEYLPAGPGGKPVKVRAPDGIHMSMTGYRLLITELTGEIRQFALAHGGSGPQARAK